MKKTLFILLAALVSNLCLAQPDMAKKGINYKALIKDDSNNVLSNQNITIQFSILEGIEVGFSNTVYVETHSISTDANGIIIANIGEGTPESGYEGGFELINWGVSFGSIFLKTQIDTGSGLLDMGTTEFKAVPYALFAQDSNNSGLEALDQGSGRGWRLIDRPVDFYGPIAVGAVDLSYSWATSQTRGATGNYATAVGLNTTASGQSSFASGVGTVASQSQATAMGAGTVASGHSSTAMGIGTRAEAPNSTAIGLYNIGGGDSLLASATDPLFEIGNGQYVNGTNDIRRNALTVLRNGTITAPSFDVSEITDEKALITKEYADANYSGGSGGTSTGLEAIDEGNGIGWRLIGQNPDSYGTIGKNAVDLSISVISSSTKGATGASSTAMGLSTTASGFYSTALGFTTTASNDYASAFGSQSEATGAVSTAFGFSSLASGSWSTAMGYNSEASGNYATAMGQETTAEGLNSTAMGINTNASGNTSTAMGANTVASGISSTAMGNLSEASGLYATAMGTNTNAIGDFTTAIGVGSTAQGDYSFASGYLTIANADYSSTFGNSTQASGENSVAMGRGTIADSPNSLVIGEYNDIRPDVLFQVGNGTGDGSDGTFRANAMTVFTNGHILAFAYDELSDRRLKTNISKLTYGLSTILQLNPVAYNWKIRSEEKEKTLGLVAQEVQPIISEIVNIGKDEDKTLSINYSQLIPILINAIQEQQEIITKQDDQIIHLKAEINDLNTLKQRVKSIETILNSQQ